MSTRIEFVGMPKAAAARLRELAQQSTALADLPPRASSPLVTFTNENGPKGGVAVRCGVTVTLAGWGRLHVEERSTTPTLALSGALAKLERRLARHRTIERENRRRPKKYFAAARALQMERRS
jgi:ribosome-associated translation inhibitor RaiA